MAESIKVGYARVSTSDQNEARQLEALKAEGISERYIFVDKASGKDFNREKYQAMLNFIRPGDVVYVCSLERLGRNYTEISRQWEHITKELGADIVVMDFPEILDTRKSKDLTGVLISDIVLKLLSYVAQKERENIRTRQAEGIAIAKAAGKYKGRKPIEINEEAFETVYKEVMSGKRTNTWAMKHLGLKKNTYYKAAAAYREKYGLPKMQTKNEMHFHHEAMLKGE